MRILPTLVLDTNDNVAEVFSSGVLCVKLTAVGIELEYKKKKKKVETCQDTARL